MGQKVHPRGFRLGVIQGWNSKWFARKDYRTFLRQDVELRRYLMKRLKTAGIAKIEIERSPAALTVSLFTAKPVWSLVAVAPVWMNSRKRLRSSTVKTSANGASQYSRS